jgi:2-(1,2-epoxy-1,2-dihydrophenyl)acetyl-CoA isomerase
MGEFTTIVYDKADGVATLTMNRPEHMNGMTTRMLREAHEALTAASRDPEVRVLVLTGAGRSFCPGADLKHNVSGERNAPGDEAEAFHYRVPVLLHEMPAVTIAAVNGPCAGAGFGWACGCDIRVASSNAMFNTAFLNVAVAGDMGLPWSLPRLVGAAKARELSFFSEKFGAEEALRMGLVARIWEEEVFRKEVGAMAARLAAKSPIALRTLKAHYVAAEHMANMGDFVDLETERHQKIVVSEDTREAFRAFLEKREPKFTGR